mmetsp:Transcript_11011/g.22233  ORF Transcript_11011/g.22233 Transcript_11011/m.22233 type:complete len:109 (+) Transcript_11011:293-619(+)
MRAPQHCCYYFSSNSFLISFCWCPQQQGGQGCGTKSRLYSNNDYTRDVSPISSSSDKKDDDDFKQGKLFYFQSGIPLMKGQTTHLKGQLEMTRTKENARLYNCRIKTT